MAKRVRRTSHKQYCGPVTMLDVESEDRHEGDLHEGAILITLDRHGVFRTSPIVDYKEPPDSDDQFRVREGDDR